MKLTVECQFYVSSCIWNNDEKLEIIYLLQIIFSSCVHRELCYLDRCICIYPYGIFVF